MTTMTAIETIKGTITISRLWGKLDLPGQVKDSKCMALCPFHHEKTPSMSIFAGGTKFWCFGCGAHGDAIDFMRLHLGLPDTTPGRSQAISHLASMFGIQGQLPEARPLRRKQPKQSHVIPEMTPLRKSEPVPDAYLDWAWERGITPNTVQAMIDEGSLYFKGGKPHYVYNGGIKARHDIRNSGSSRWIVGSPKESLFRLKAASGWSVSTLFICEGESDTMAVFQEISGIRGTAVVGAPNATFNPPPAMAAMLGSNRRVILCLDNYEAGRRAGVTIAEALKLNARDCVLADFWEPGEQTKDVCAMSPEARRRRLLLFFEERRKII